MAGNLRHGFKSAAERLAAEVRADHGLASTAPVNCAVICESLGIPIVTVPELVASGASPESVRQILAPDAKFSAMTVAAGTRLLIVYNNNHPTGRLANSLAHELSHILLEHPMTAALGEGGCRNWDARLEAEADWQAGALLVPRDAGLAWMRSGKSLEDGAKHFGVSLALFQWRINQTGVKRQLAASSFSAARKRTA